MNDKKKLSKITISSPGSTLPKKIEISPRECSSVEKEVYSTTKKESIYIFASVSYTEEVLDISSLLSIKKVNKVKTLTFEVNTYPTRKEIIDIVMHGHNINIQTTNHNILSYSIIPKKAHIAFIR